MYRTKHLCTLLFLLTTLLLPSITNITLHQQTPTNPLQTLINQTPDDTTLHLPPTTYTTPITINKPLTIIGNNTILSTTSAYNSYAIHITHSNVTLKNLTITNHGPGLYTTGIKITAPNTTIESCTITNTPVGIAIWNHNTTIKNCHFKHCNDEGIAILGTPTRPIHQTTIQQSHFINNCDGIELQSAYHTTITDSYFTHQTHAGIDAIGTQNTNLTLQNCSLANSSVFDIYLAHTNNTHLQDCSYDTKKVYCYNSEPVTSSNSAENQTSNQQRSNNDTFRSRWRNHLQNIIHILTQLLEKINMFRERITSLEK